MKDAFKGDFYKSPKSFHYGISLENGRLFCGVTNPECAAEAYGHRTEPFRKRGD